MDPGPEYLVHVPLLQAAFREPLRRLFQVHDWRVDPDVWGKEWGVHIQPAGNGGGALKCLGNYVARTAISDSRMVRMDDTTVTFRWKNRAANGRGQDDCFDLESRKTGTGNRRVGEWESGRVSGGGVGTGAGPRDSSRFGISLFRDLVE